MKKILLSALLAFSWASGQAATYQYNFSFVPEGAGTGSGTGSAIYNDVTHSFQMSANFSGLSGTVSQTHFHGATTTPGVGNAGIMVGNTSLPGFPLGGTSGNYSQTIDLSQSSVYSVAFFTSVPIGSSVANAEAAFITALNQGRSYWNIHSSTFPGGEIRAWATLVPEPSSLALVGIGVAFIARRWSRRSP
jgi:hypothetical protein